MNKFDIERFPRSPTGNRMLKRVSPIYGNSYVAKWLYEVMGMEFDEAKKHILEMREQLFTSTVTWGIEYQEHKYSIVPDNNLTLDERRLRLYRKRVGKSPISPWKIENYARNAWNMSIDIDETYANGIFLILINEDDDNNLRKMLRDLREMKPSHLSWKLVYQQIFDGEADTILTTEGFYGACDIPFHDIILYGNDNQVWEHDNIGVHGEKLAHHRRYGRNSGIRHGMQSCSFRRHMSDNDLLRGHDKLIFNLGLNLHDAASAKDSAVKSALTIAPFSDKYPELTDNEKNINVYSFLRRNGSFRHDDGLSRCGSEGLVIDVNAKSLYLHSHDAVLCRGSFDVVRSGNAVRYNS